jgi:hypothetical protein
MYVAREKSLMASDVRTPSSLDSPARGESTPDERIDSPIGGWKSVVPTGQTVRRRQETYRTMSTELTGVIADHLAAVNAFDTDAIVATLAPDAYVNDARREINGVDAIRGWVENEMAGDPQSTVPDLGMSRQRSIGEPETLLLVGDIDDATRGYNRGRTDTKRHDDVGSSS